MKQRIY